jgi:hypothetical protein
MRRKKKAASEAIVSTDDGKAPRWLWAAIMRGYSLRATGDPRKFMWSHHVGSKRAAEADVVNINRENGEGTAFIWNFANDAEEPNYHVVMTVYDDGTFDEDGRWQFRIGNGPGRCSPPIDTLVGNELPDWARTDRYKERATWDYGEFTAD